MRKAQNARKALSETEYLRLEIEALQALRRRGGVTLVLVGDKLITAYQNDRKVLR